MKRKPEDRASEPCREADAAEAGEGSPEAGEDTPSELEQLKEQVKEYERRLLRLQADFDNYRKRMTREQSRWGEDARAELVGSLLPVLDDLERALEQEGDPESIRQGISMIRRQLLETLGKYGVKPIQAQGQAFDPNYHDAVMVEESEEHPEGTVLEEFRTGYTLGERLIRPCAVKVARCPQDEESQNKEVDDR